MKFFSPFISLLQQDIILWKELQKNKTIALMTRLSLLLSLLTIISIIVFWRSLPPLIPFWFSRPWGTERLAPTWYITILPFSALVFHAINILFCIHVTKEHLVFSQMLYISSMFVTFLTSISTMMIIWITI